jgi:RimJ/RimL family protein N-acetyltransferase
VRLADSSAECPEAMSDERRDSREPVPPRTIRLRGSSPADVEFLAALYASTRWEELAPVPWNDEQKRAFLRHQFDLQAAEYARAYPGASFDVVELDGEPVGRLYVNRGRIDNRIVDLAIVAAWRNRGIGGRLLAALIEEADATSRSLSIHVEAFNLGARRLYERFGFRLAEDKGVYLLLARPPGGSTDGLDAPSAQS